MPPTMHTPTMRPRYSDTSTSTTSTTSTSTTRTSTTSTSSRLPRHLHRRQDAGALSSSFTETTMMLSAATEAGEMDIGEEDALLHDDGGHIDDDPGDGVADADVIAEPQVREWLAMERRQAGVVPHKAADRAEEATAAASAEGGQHRLRNIVVRRVQRPSAPSLYGHGDDMAVAAPLPSSIISALAHTSPTAAHHTPAQAGEDSGVGGGGVRRSQSTMLIQQQERLMVMQQDTHQSAASSPSPSSSSSPNTQSGCQHSPPPKSMREIMMSLYGDGWTVMEIQAHDTYACGNDSGGGNNSGNGGVDGEATPETATLDKQQHATHSATINIDIALHGAAAHEQKKKKRHYHSSSYASKLLQGKSIMDTMPPLSQRVQVECLSLHFDNFDQSTAFEPLFLEMYLINTKKKEQLSERFYFHLNRESLISSVNHGSNAGSSANRSAFAHHLTSDITRATRSPLQLGPKLKNASNTRPQAVFLVDEPDQDIYLVLSVERILSGQTVDQSVRPYQDSRHHDTRKLRAKQHQISQSHLGRFRQKILFGFIPLYKLRTPAMDPSPLYADSLQSYSLPNLPHVRNRDKLDQEKQTAETQKSVSFTRKASSIFSFRNHSSSSQHMLKKGDYGGPLQPLAPSSTSSSSTSHDNRSMFSLLTPRRGQLSKSIKQSMSSNRLNMRFKKGSSSTPRPPKDNESDNHHSNNVSPATPVNPLTMQELMNADGVKVSNVIVDKDLLTLMEGQVSFTEMYKMPLPSSGNIREFDVCDYIQNDNLRRSLRHVENASFTVNISRCSITEDEFQAATDQHLKKQDMQHTLVPFRLEMPWFQTYQYHYLFVTPRFLDATRLPKSENARNISCKIMLRTEDTFDPNRSLSAEQVIAHRYQPDHYLRQTSTAVTYHERTPYFDDQIKICLPLLRDADSSKMHVLIVFYHVSCTRKKTKTRKVHKTLFANHEEDENVRVIGYSYIKCSAFLHRKKAHKLPIHTTLSKDGYLSKDDNQASQPPSTSFPAVFRVDTDLISNVHIPDGLLRRFLNRSDDLLALVHARHGTIFAEECSKAEADDERYLSMVDSLATQARGLVESRTIRYDELRPSFSLITSLLLTLLTTVFHYKKKYISTHPTGNTSTIDQLLTMTFRFLLKLLRNMAEMTHEQHMFASAVDLRKTVEELKDNVLKYFVDYVFRGFAVKSTNGASICTTLHEALVSTWSQSLRDFDHSNYMNVVYFFYDIIVKDVVLFLGDHCHTDQERVTHLESIRQPIKRLIKVMGKHLSEMCHIGSFVVQVKITAANKHAAHFISVLSEIMDPQLVVALFCSYYKQFHASKMTDQKMELVLDALAIMVNNDLFLVLNGTPHHRHGASHNLSQMMIETVEQVFHEHPFLRGKASSVLATHLDGLSQRYHAQRTILQYIANFYIPLFDSLACMASKPFDLIGKDGAKNCMVALTWILYNVPRCTLRRWIVTHGDDANVLSTFVYVLSECKRLNHGNASDMDMAILSLLDTFLQFSVSSNLERLPAMDNVELRAKITNLCLDYLQNLPHGLAFRYLPLVLANLALVFYEHYRASELSETWSKITGQLIRLADNNNDGAYKTVLETFYNVYNDHTQGAISDSLLGVLIGKLFEADAEAYSNQFFDLYHIWTSPSWLLTMIWVKVFDYPEQVLSVMNMWLSKWSQDFIADVSLAERGCFLLHQLISDLREIVHKLLPAQRQGITKVIDTPQGQASVACPSPQFSLARGKFTARAFSSIRCQEQLRQLLQQAHSLSSEFQILHQRAQQNHEASKASELYLQLEDKDEKMLLLFRHAGMHADVLALLLYGMQDRDRALEYCFEVISIQKRQQQQKDIDPLASEPRPLVLLLDMILNPHRYRDSVSSPCLQDHLSDNEVERDNIAFCRSIVKRHASMLTSSELLKHVSSVDKLGIATLKPLLQAEEDNYEMIKKLGRGTQGSVLLARNKKTSREVAVKIVQFEDDDGATASLREVQSMIRISNENIVQFEDFFTREQKDRIGGMDYSTLFGCLVIEYLPGGDLLQAMLQHQRTQTPFDDRDVQNFIRQIASAMSLMHEQDIIHRDLKPDNILLSENGQYKVADFGLAKEIGHQHSRQNSIVGTLIYMSPELYKGAHYNSATDIWSFGVILFEMLNLQVGRKDLKYEVQTNKFFVQQWIEQLLKGRYSAKVLYILHNCLLLEPDARLTASQILIVLDKMHATEAEDLYRRSLEYNRDDGNKDESDGSDAEGSSRETSSEAAASKRKRKETKLTRALTGKAGNLRQHVLQKYQQRQQKEEQFANQIRRGGSRSNARDWQRDTTIYGHDHLYLFRLVRPDTADVAGRQYGSVGDVHDERHHVDLHLGHSFNTSNVSEALMLKRSDIVSDVVQFLMTCEESSPGPRFSVETAGGDSDDEDNLSSTLSVDGDEEENQLRKYQEALLMTLNYFCRPEDMLHRIIVLCQSTDMNSTIRAMRTLHTWTSRGNLCHYNNVTVSLLLKFCFSKVGKNGSNMSIAGPMSPSRKYRHVKNSSIGVSPRLSTSSYMHIIEQHNESSGENGGNEMLGPQQQMLSELMHVLKAELAKQLSHRRTHSKDTLRQTHSTRRGRKNAPEPIMPKMSHNLRLIEFSEVEIARQMTLIDFEDFCDVKPFEFMLLGLESGSRYRRAPHILRSITHFDRVSRWVACVVLQKRDMHSRALRIVKLINIAENLHKMNNFNALKALVFGLNFTAVDRLTKTWAVLQREHVTAMKLLQQFITLCESNSEMDKRVRECDGRDKPCVPFIGTYLSLIKTLEMELPTYQEGQDLDMRRRGVTDILNCDKFVKIAHIIKEVQRLQARKYILRGVPILQDKLNFIRNSKDMKWSPKIQHGSPKLSATSNRAHRSNATGSHHDDTMIEVIYDDKSLFQRSLELEP